MLRFFILATVLGLTSFRVHAQTAVGAVSAMQGTVVALRGNSEITLTPNASIFADDILETDAAGKLQITFVDDTVLTLGPGSEVLVDEFVYNPAASTGNAALRITSGAARVLAGAIEQMGGGQALRIDTPVATIGIRGTDFFIEMDSGHLQVALFSGYEVVVTNTAGESVLRPGEGTDIWGEGAPSRGRTWGTDRINRALALVSVTPNHRPLPYAMPMAEADTLQNALTGGEFKVDARLRYEDVSRENAVDGFAATARVRIGYETQSFNGLFAGIEGEITRAIDSERRTLIPDPDSEELNRLYVGWSAPAADGMSGTKVVVGRQRIGYDNERWVGAALFRQNDQTFDAVTAETRVPHLYARYAYVDRVNRILGNNPGGRWHTDGTHLFNATTDVVPYGLVTAYAYLLDIAEDTRMATATYGMRYDGLYDRGTWAMGLEAEYARQTDYADNATDHGLDYWLLRPSAKWRDTTIFAGLEKLGGNTISAVQTPFATLHRHNGWADVFTVTPVTGLRDAHVRVLQEFPDVAIGPLTAPKIDVRYHDFNSDIGGNALGTEWDFDVNATLPGNVTIGTRYARFDGASDVTKVWMYVEFVY